MEFKRVWISDQVAFTSRLVGVVLLFHMSHRPLIHTIRPADRPTNHPQHANVYNMDIQTTIHHVYWVLSPKTSTYLLTTGY